MRNDSRLEKSLAVAYVAIASLQRYIENWLGDVTKARRYVTKRGVGDVTMADIYNESIEKAVVLLNFPCGYRFLQRCYNI